jgi:glycosyltransferase involved in cell wall biosynthesis
VVALVAKLRRARFYYSSANVIDFEYDQLEPKRHNVRLFHLGVRMADGIIVQTEEQEELCRKHFDRSPSVIRSVAEPAEQRTAEPDAFLWIGRYAPYKRPLDYVELARAVPEARFKMVGVVGAGAGAEELEQSVSAAAEELANLELVPALPRDELMPLIARAVAIVNTAEYEGMPNIFLEGWARGVPALALFHDPDGVIEREGVGAFASGSSEQMAALARTMWDQRGDQRELASRCREYVHRNHDLESIVDAWAAALGLRLGSPTSSA